MIRLIPYLLYLLLIPMHQVIWKEVTGIYGATISLPVLLVLLLAVYKDELPVVWFGFFAGLMAGAGIPERFGWMALELALIGVAAYHVRERLNLDSIYSKLLMIFGGVLVSNLCWLVIIGADSFWYHVAIDAVPSTIYTTTVAWFFFLIKEGRITPQKIRSIF